MLSLSVRRPEEVLWAKQEVMRFVAAEAFGPADRTRIEVAARELLTNMVKHAGGGRLTVERLARDGRHGVRMTALDQGPGITDVAGALRPGTSSTGTHGDGLAAVQELMDKFELTTEPGRWTRVEVEKWLA